MKPLHIVLLVAAGALGGAGVLKLSQSHPPPAPPSAATAPAPAAAASPAATAAAAPSPAPVLPPVSPVPVSPAPVAAAPAPENARRAPAIPRRSTPRQQPPVEVARNREPPAPAPQPEAQPAPSATVPAPEPQPEADPAPLVAPPVAPPAPQPPRQVTLKPGTLLYVRLVDGLSSERNVPGDEFHGTLDQPLSADGLVIAERGARVVGRVTASDRGGKVRGVSALSVELTRIRTSDGQTVAISTGGFERKADQSRGDDAAKAGAGAAIGAVIGAIAGGGKGAAIGAGAGGAAGAAGVLLTRGKPATLPSETRLSFRIREAVTITERQR